MPAAQRRELAWAHLSPLLEGRPVHQFDKALRKDPRFAYPDGRPRSAGALSGYASSAVHEGWIRLEKIDGAGEPPRPRLSYVEAEVKARFPDLAAAIVVATADGADEDAVLRQVGRALAHEIATATFPVIAHGQSIALGSGRSVHHVVEALRGYADQAPLARNARLLALTGNVFADDPNQIARYDANQHVATMSGCFQSAQLDRITSRIAHYGASASVQDRNRVASCWLSDTNYPDNIPDHAIIGIGTLTGRHRFSVAIEHPPAPPSLAPIYEQLKRLVANVTAIMKQHPLWCPVGDICNRLLYVPYGASREADGASDDLAPMRTRIKEILADIDFVNQRLLTITKTKLRQFKGNVMVCTGGSRPKAHLLAFLLDYMPDMIRTVAIDRETAAALTQIPPFTPRADP